MFDSVRLEITGRCDMKCLYCHAGEKNTIDYNKEELPHKRWIEVIKECKNLGITNFVFTGGEVFLYPGLFDLIKVCGADARVVISTNGKHFSEKNLARLKSFPQIKEFRTSLDGLATNDIIREGSAYIKSLKSLARLKEVLPDKRIMIQTVLYENNLLEIPLLYEKLKGLGIYCWRLSQLWKTVRTERNRHILDFSSYKKMFDLYVEIIKKHQHDNKPFLLRIDNVYYSWIESEDYASMELRGHPCQYNFRFLCINANGDLIFCPALNTPFATIKHQTIEEAVETSSWLNKFKCITVESLGCDKCRYINICGGGCRADALRWLGDISSIDPNSCCMMPLVENLILPLLGTKEQRAFGKLVDQKGMFPSIFGENIKEAVLNHNKGG